jgi:hydroxymethylglutaryl-CoA reductase (NADPH)
MAVQRTNSKIPRSGENDYTPEAAAGRREFPRERTGAAFDHVSEFSFDPALAQGNIENFIGVAQVPLGVAGPCS